MHQNCALPMTQAYLTEWVCLPGSSGNCLRGDSSQGEGGQKSIGLANDNRPEKRGIEILGQGKK